jgi:hypothetical protein
MTNALMCLFAAVMFLVVSLAARAVARRAPNDFLARRNRHAASGGAVFAMGFFVAAVGFGLTAMLDYVR